MDNIKYTGYQQFGDQLCLNDQYKYVTVYVTVRSGRWDRLDAKYIILSLCECTWKRPHQQMAVCDQPYWQYKLLSN